MQLDPLLDVFKGVSLVGPQFDGGIAAHPHPAVLLVPESLVVELPLAGFLLLLEVQSEGVRLVSFVHVE